ncbi:MAG: chromosome partitioning protein [Deltaproteobacteria bacterium HGW-Deltaproteobacteria-14]|jgi:ATP-binding protein involved in chromosome partitioning|nr:MAG: chromosome partitioning protein [Deltaproteobacteria bacterium HGW-Deltaproteobacteria-14]
MANFDKATILEALGTVDDPDLHRDLVSLGMIRDLEIAGDVVTLRVVLTTPACPLKAKIQRDVEEALHKVGVEKMTVTMDAEVHRANPAGAGGQNATQAERMPGVKAVVAVASGKGGVGKSTVAVNLAISLQRLGAKVGILDADIYGPSLPIMLGLRDTRPTMTADERIAPVQRYGLHVMSMGFMLRDDQAVVWRGPMLGKALQQFIEDVDWGELDYVIVDMPPGTGDVQLSLAQLLPVAGTVVVTTPQDVAFADVRRAIKQFELTKTPVLGIVENMSHFICGNCGAAHHIFGESRIESHAAKHNLPVLAKIPLDSVTAIAADQGEPIVVAAPDSETAQSYKVLAQRVAQAVAIETHKSAGLKEKLSGFFGKR